MEGSLLWQATKSEHMPVASPRISPPATRRGEAGHYRQRRIHLTRSCDRTLVQSLALDEDRRTSDHDYLCEWIATGNMHSVKDMVDMVYTYGPRIKGTHDDAFHKGASEMHAEAQTEVIVTKGSGEYQSLVGFLDVVCEVDCNPNFNGKEGNLVANEYDARGGFIRLVGIEVKSGRGPVNIPLVIRQIGLYRTFAREIHHWMLACRDPQDRNSIKLLHQADISCWFISEPDDLPYTHGQLFQFATSKDRRIFRP